MSSDPSSPHVRPRSPTPLSQWRTKASSSKGKNLTWVRGRDANPTAPSLLARISDAATNGHEDDSSVDGSENPPGMVAVPFEQREAEEIGEISEVIVAGKKSQDELPTQTTTSGMRIKTEETPVTIPSPTRSEFSAGRKRGSRSTIDVFGEPTVPVSPVRRNSVIVIPKEEEIAVDFSSNGVIDVDAFLATLSPSKPKPRLVSSPPSMSLEPSTSTNQTPHSTANIASTTAVPPSESNPTSSLQPSPYPQDILDKCRHILVPLVERNAKLRRPSLDEELVKSRAFKLLSDKLCTDFIKLAKKVHEQISLHPPPPRRTPSADDVLGQKRGREESQDSLEHPRKVAKLESPEEMVLDDVDATTSPSSLVPVAPTEDIQMNEDIENIAPEHPSEPLVSGTGVDVTHPLSSREPSAALPLGPGSGANQQHLDISTPERAASAETDIPIPLQENAPASSPDHVEHNVLSVHATVAAGDEKDEASPSNSSPAHTPSNTAPVPAALTASGPPSRSTSPHANDASASDVAAEPGTSSHESELDHAASDIDAELSVNRILDPASEDEPVAHTPVDDMPPPKQSVNTPEPPVVYPPCLVPGVWQAVMGQPSSRIEEIDFFVDDATADAVERWSRRRDSFSPNERHVVVHLLCVPHTTAEAILQDTSLSPEAIAHELFISESDWPGPGELVVVLNSNSDSSKPDSKLSCSGKSWIVQTPWTTPLEITSHVRRGHNTLKLIQLAGLSDRLFVIHAREPLEEEKAAAYNQITAWQTIRKRWSPPHNVVAKTRLKSPPALTTSRENTPPKTPLVPA
ncbi:hypothetical protein GSI_02219 [Ganoderma sinense ZZ0214-1]|uniref:Uncharacterized protein n=1 Tax=Ganoderma sinense ZZ0214-1 TaxID=1077348 RepID=A0A2G8SP04_9APHY|nr:hypothetical protein GSI_02219 [Ganoderma sinense ZZ0214-1]